MIPHLTSSLCVVVLVLAVSSFVYYLLSIYSAWRFFGNASQEAPRAPDYTPPASILKPVRGLDREAYENYASFCRLDYPEYEILFAVSEADDPAIPVIRKLIHDFPERSIRLLVGADEIGTNNKVCKLCRLVREARYSLLVISDSDVRVDPDYLRTVAAPFHDPQVGAVTSLFRGVVDRSLGSEIDCVGASSEFCGSAVVARQLEGVRFTLGATMATTRQALAEIGGFEALANCHSDDFELGNRLAARSYRIELVREPVWMVYPSQTLGKFLQHELRWAIGLRHVRPWGHLSLVFTHGLPWALAAVACAHSAAVRLAYLAGYILLRAGMAWTVGVWGLRDPVLRRRLWLVPLRDALAFFVWLASFFSHRITWRGQEFSIQNGRLVPVSTVSRARLALQPQAAWDAGSDARRDG